MLILSETKCWISVFLFSNTKTTNVVMKWMTQGLCKIGDSASPVLFLQALLEDKGFFYHICLIGLLVHPQPIVLG